MKRPENPIKLDSGTYSHENFYFGDWIPLRNPAGQVVGFKIIPFAKDEYLEKQIFPAKFVTRAANVSVEKAGKDTYIYILLAQGQALQEDSAQFIEAAIFHNQKDDFIVRLDGFRDEDWSQLGFEFTEVMAAVALWQ
jgi:hypothetical protein